MIFKPHSEKQALALFSEKPIVIIASGIQFGKTRCGNVKTMMAMHRFTDPDDNFLVTAPTYKVMQQATLPGFMQFMRDKGDFSKADMTFKMHGGGTCYFRTCSDPDSIIGITNIRFIHSDEAGLYPLYFWENVLARAAFKNAQICVTTSPYTLNWIYSDYIRPILKNGPESMPHVELIRARSNENPFFPQDYYDRMKATMDPRRFQMMFDGDWHKFAGLVYDCFEYEVNTCEPSPLPAGTKYYAGVDWGFTNPFALTVRGITPDGYHVQVGEIYERHLTINDMVARAIDLKKVWNIERFYCDPSSPASIEEFCRNGLSAVAADNDIRKGIDAHYELIKSGRFKMFRGRNKYSESELETYRYPADEDNRGPDQDYRERLPVARDNHSVDSQRYLSVALVRHIPLTPVMVDPAEVNKKQESFEQRMKRLKTLSNSNVTEEWS